MGYAIFQRAKGNCELIGLGSWKKTTEAPSFKMALSQTHTWGWGASLTFWPSQIPCVHPVEDGVLPLSFVHNLK